MQQMPPQQPPFPNDGYPPQHPQYAQQPPGAGYAGYPPNSNVPMSQSVHELGNNMQHLSVHDASPHQQQVLSQAQNGHQQREPSRQESQAAQRRSQSVPRRVRQNAPSDNDLFTGVTGGYWSEGQALRNLRRHEQMKGEAAPGNYGPRSRRGRAANSVILDR
ncbi:hypothetical protein AAVH_03231 [Aphelenchoides avenae]|nr:hypothetical protein AAVH_03231 [Aphelenchus avenae]